MTKKEKRKFKFHQGTYEGEVFEGFKVPDGFGTLIIKFGRFRGDKYEGEWKMNNFHGKGTYTSSEGWVCEGQWEESKKHGQVKISNKDGSSYIGEYKHDNKHGIGTQIYPNGEKYEGGWYENTYFGHGTKTYINGDKYIGKWRGGRRERKGKLLNPKGEIIKEDELYNDYFSEDEIE